MSALTIASATIDTTGKIATCAITGNIGALSFTASPGFLGFIVYTEAGTQYSIPTGPCTISGTNVTIPILGIIPASGLITSLQVQGAQFNGGNLTDTASSTSPNNTVTPTNSSTVATAATPALIYDNLGFFAHPWDDTVSGPAFMGLGTQDFSTVATLDFVVNGTDFVLNYKSNHGTSASISASVDGGSYNNVGYTQFGNLTAALIFTGLSAVNHTVSIKYLTGVVKIDKDIMGFVYGGTGIISQPLGYTTGSGYTYPAAAFHQYQLVGAGNAISSYFTPECGTSTTANKSAAWGLDTSAINPQYYVGQSFSFTINIATTPTVQIFAGAAAEAFVIRADGAEVGHFTAANVANTSQYLDISSAFSGLSTGSHNIVITLVGWQTAMFIGNILTSGATITTSPPAARGHWIFHGDSITLGLFTPAVLNNGNIGYRDTWPHMVASAKNKAYTNRGKSGAPCHYFNGSGETPNVDSGEHTAPDIVNCNHTVEEGFGLWFDNDCRQVGSNSAGRPHAVTTQAITASGSPQTVTMTGGPFTVGQVVQVDIGAADSSNPGANYEAVTMTATNTGVFTKNHLIGITMSMPELLSEAQASFFNLIQTVLSGLPSVIWHEFGMLPMGDAGNAAAYGLTTTGFAANIGSGNIALWNSKKAAAMLTSGSGNGKGDNSTYLTSGQSARAFYHDTVPFAINGTTNPNYDVSNQTSGVCTGTQTNYITNYVSTSPTGVHLNDAGTQTPNSTDLGNGIMAQNVLAAISPPSIFRSSGSQFNTRKGSRQFSNR